MRASWVAGRWRWSVKRLRLIGVPSSAGAHAPGVERGPQWLRAAGLLDALARAGIGFVDAGDLPVSHFATTAAASGARKLPAVLRGVQQVAEAGARACADGDVAGLPGGDRTRALGAGAGPRPAPPDPGGGG